MVESLSSRELFRRIVETPSPGRKTPARQEPTTETLIAEYVDRTRRAAWSTADEERVARWLPTLTISIGAELREWVCYQIKDVLRCAEAWDINSTRKTVMDHHRFMLRNNAALMNELFRRRQATGFREMPERDFNLTAAEAILRFVGDTVVASGDTTVMDEVVKVIPDGPVDTISHSLKNPDHVLKRLEAWRALEMREEGAYHSALLVWIAGHSTADAALILNEEEIVISNGLQLAELELS